jgi:hypothetical protein
MPAGINAGRTRADRKKITVPVTAAELAIVDKQARRAGLTRAEFVRRLVLTHPKSTP